MDRSETVSDFTPSTILVRVVAGFFGFAAVAAAVDYERGAGGGCDGHFCYLGFQFGYWCLLLFFGGEGCVMRMRVVCTVVCDVWSAYLDFERGVNVCGLGF